VTTTTESCTICDGTGWKIRIRDHHREAVRCQCWLGQRGERLLASAGIPPRYQDCELSTFSTHPSESIAHAHLLATRFVENYPLERAGLLLVGEVGVGKTHLAVGILKELARQKQAKCLFYDYRHLLKTIQDTYRASNSFTEMEVLRPIIEVEVLLFDELGVVRPTDWVRDTISHILNMRYNEERTTIITTNFADLPPLMSEREAGENLTDAQRAVRQDTLGDRVGERIWSRLHEMCRTIEMHGPDYRREFKSLRPTRRRFPLRPRGLPTEDPKS